MPISQPRLWALTPVDIRETARYLRASGETKPVQNWYTLVDGERFPSRQLVKEAAARLEDAKLPPLDSGTTSHEAVAVLSHNGFVSRNASWQGTKEGASRPVLVDRT